MATREIIINGVVKGKLTLPDTTTEDEWRDKLSAYNKNTSFQKVQMMHNFNIDAKIKFVAENIDLKISSLPTPDGYTSMRDFAKQQLSSIYSDMQDFSYPEAIAKIMAKQLEADSHPEWAPIITRERLEKFKNDIYLMIAGLGL